MRCRLDVGMGGVRRDQQHHEEVMPAHVLSRADAGSLVKATTTVLCLIRLWRATQQRTCVSTIELASHEREDAGSGITSCPAAHARAPRAHPFECRPTLSFSPSGGEVRRGARFLLAQLTLKKLDANVTA